MLVLVGYGLILHVLSFVVLQVKYYVLKGKLEPLEEPVPRKNAGAPIVVSPKKVTPQAPEAAPQYSAEVDV